MSDEVAKAGELLYGELQNILQNSNSNATIHFSQDKYIYVHFPSNLSERLNQPFFSAFIASFASNFLFLSFVFLCAMAPWGCLFIFLAPAFKGFGTGLSAGYLFITYGFKGIGFYLLVMLSGTFIFCFALIIECLQAHFLSCKIAGCVFRDALADTPINIYVRRFLLRSLYVLIISACAAIIDMLLWTAFSGVFPQVNGP